MYIAGWFRCSCTAFVFCTTGLIPGFLYRRYIGGLVPDITEQDIRDEFYSFGEIASVRVVAFKMCAFVTFTTRAAAEKAAAEKGPIEIKGQRCRMMWGRPQQPREPGGGQGGGRMGGGGGEPGGSGSGGMMPPPAPMQVQAAMGLAGPSGSGSGGGGGGGAAGGGMPYASMDPQAMGTRIPAPGETSKRGVQGEEGGGPDSKRTRGPEGGGTGYGAPPA